MNSKCKFAAQNYTCVYKIHTPTQALHLSEYLPLKSSCLYYVTPFFNWSARRFSICVFFTVTTFNESTVFHPAVSLFNHSNNYSVFKIHFFASGDN